VPTFAVAEPEPSDGTRLGSVSPCGRRRYPRYPGVDGQQKVIELHPVTAITFDNLGEVD